MNTEEEEFKENVRREILYVPQKQLLLVNFNIFKEYKEFVRVHGHHFQHLL
jgi:hypothetical protein